MHEVVNEAGHWIYEDGHLVIVGDIFDRGEKVTETLWFLFHLEKEAQKAGGKVHVLLGNHELMVLHNDLSYINVKYRYTSGLMRKPYSELFSKESLLGQWLRSKNICVTINDVVFVHGGFSKKIIEKEQNLAVINQTFKKQIYPKVPNADLANDFIGELYFKNGPLWYRGYANPEGFDKDQANFILESLGMNTIVVGHTSMPRIVSNYNNKIILIDSSIKFGKAGELLSFENGNFYRCLMDGTKINLKDKEKQKIKTAFQYVYDLGDNNLKLELTFDVEALYSNKLSDDYLPGSLLAIHNKELNRKWDIRVASRGNTRRKICSLPPLKIDLQKSNLKVLGFATNDKLKLILPCEKSKTYVENCMKEHLVYQLYGKITDIAFRTRLIDLEILNESDKKVKVNGKALMVEDIDDISYRTKALQIKDGVTGIDALDRKEYLKFVFFQYMILNCDWSILTRHNVKVIRLPNSDQLTPLPYDFDYAGIVGQNYAVPPEKFPIESVLSPYFMGFHVKMEEIEFVLEHYNSIEKELRTLIDEAKYYLSEKSCAKFHKRLDGFYKVLRNKKGWKKNFQAL